MSSSQRVAVDNVLHYVVFTSVVIQVYAREEGRRPPESASTAIARPQTTGVYGSISVHCICKGEQGKQEYGQKRLQGEWQSCSLETIRLTHQCDQRVTQAFVMCCDPHAQNPKCVPMVHGSLATHVGQYHSFLGASAKAGFKHLQWYTASHLHE